MGENIAKLLENLPAGCGVDGWKYVVLLEYALPCSRRMGENTIIRRMGEIKVAEWANIKRNGQTSAPNGRIIRRMGEAIRLNGRKYLKN